MIFAMIATQFNAKYQVVKARTESKGKFYRSWYSSELFLAADDTQSDYVTSGAADKDAKFYSKFKVTTVMIQIARLDSNLFPPISDKISRRASLKRSSGRLPFVWLT